MRPRPRHGRRSTPAGEHRAVLLDETLRVLDPKPGGTFVDATVGWGGHASEILRRVGPEGLVVGFDLDAENLARARERLTAIGHPFDLRHGNFAGVSAAADVGRPIDGLVADLGFSSMQVDDPARGFSYRREGPLDMRLDRTRGKTAADLVATLSADDLARALRELADEPQAIRFAQAIVAARDAQPIVTTTQLAQVLMEASGQADWRLKPKPGEWKLHPAARTFQALRILVNRELANLEALLRSLPTLVRPGGVAAVIAFHSGEDRLVKAAFRDGLRTGLYSEASDDPLRATYAERFSNPRSRSAKLRWARVADAGE